MYKTETEAAETNFVEMTLALNDLAARALNNGEEIDLVEEAGKIAADLDLSDNEMNEIIDSMSALSTVVKVSGENSESRWYASAGNFAAVLLERARIGGRGDLLDKAVAWQEEMIKNGKANFKFGESEFQVSILKSSEALNEKEAQEIKIGEGVQFERIRRITGYLVGTLDRFNNAKRAEESQRVKHSLSM